MSCEGCKKTFATGARTTFLWMEERCFGNVNEDAGGTVLGTYKRIELNSESIVNEIGTFNSESLNPERALRRRMQGASSIGGDVNVELTNNGYAWLIVQAIGKLIGSGITADPYTILPVDVNGVDWDGTAGYQQDSANYEPYEVIYDDGCSDCTGYRTGYYEVDGYNMEPGFTSLISRDGGTIKDINGNDFVNHGWFRYTGCRVNTWSIAATPTGIITSTFAIMGREEEIVDMAVPQYAERPEVNDPFSGFNGGVTIDGETQCILNFDMSLTNNLNGDKFCMGDRYRNSLPEGRREITGNISMELTDLIFYNKFLHGTSAIFTIEFDLLGDGTETMKIILPRIEFNGTTPTAGGNEALTQPLPYVGMWEESPADSLLVKGASTVTPNGFDIAIEIVTTGALV